MCASAVGQSLLQGGKMVRKLPPNATLFRKKQDGGGAASTRSWFKRQNLINLQTYGEVFMGLFVLATQPNDSTYICNKHAIDINIMIDTLT
jgi:hypothetical protein